MFEAFGFHVGHLCEVVTNSKTLKKAVHKTSGWQHFWIVYQRPAVLPQQRDTVGKDRDGRGGVAHHDIEPSVTGQGQPPTATHAADAEQEKIKKIPPTHKRKLTNNILRNFSDTFDSLDYQLFIIYLIKTRPEPYCK